MIDALRHTLTERREAAGLSLTHVSDCGAGRLPELSRFEGRGAEQSQPRAKTLNRIVAGYALALGIEPDELWRGALETFLASPDAEAAKTEARGRAQNRLVRDDD